ncbi:hypothetical protein Daesc_006238 [Daldinia eschscholtzii]|uniref:Uncharacterized protein n=1 Tax=Daldinia eschscholtzii TaxID=292717 RepID=A0AAX6MGH8_9PEZI
MAEFAGVSKFPVNQMFLVKGRPAATQSSGNSGGENEQLNPTRIIPVEAGSSVDVASTWRWQRKQRNTSTDATGCTSILIRIERSVSDDEGELLSVSVEEELA